MNGADGHHPPLSHEHSHEGPSNLSPPAASCMQHNTHEKEFKIENKT
jgi:hypothetical protein